MNWETAIEKFDPRFFITKTQFVYHDYTGCAIKLGARFVGEACQVARDQRTAAGVTKRTWLDNYVVRLAYLFGALMTYQEPEYREPEAENIPDAISDFTQEHWTDFGIWLNEKIRNEPGALKTKSKEIHTSNKLFALLAQAKVIPIKIELESLLPRSNAKIGESKSTKMGWAKKEKTETVLSPFAFHSDKHDRNYDYTPYQPLARCLLLSAVPVLSIFYGNYSAGRAKHFHNALNSLLSHLATQKSQGAWPDFFELLESEDFRKISSLQWEAVIYHWRDFLISPQNPESNRKLLTSHGTVKTLNLIWERLFGSSLVPEVVIIGYKNAKKKSESQPRQSLAQLTKKLFSKETEEAIWTSLTRFFNGTEKTEALEFIRSLCSEFSPEFVKSLSIQALIEKIHELNETRLEALRKCAENEFLHWHEHWERGQLALASAIHTGEELVDLLDSPLRSYSERRKNSGNLLLNGPEDTRLGNALRYVITTNDGIISGLLGRYHHLMRSLGGRHAFHAYLHPHQNAILALWVLLLVDTGANSEVIREMPWDCLSKSEQQGYWQLNFAPKLRANAKTISDELSEIPEPGQRLSAIQAIKYYKLMAARYHALADIESRSTLFLHEYSGSIHGLTEWTGRAWFIEFLKRHDTISGLRAVPSMIRPSVLMGIQHLNADNVVAAQVMGDHTKPSTTLMHYTGRTPTKLKYNLLIREFQERYQAVIIASIDGAASKLGLTELEFQRILSDAARTGLGVACLNPLAGVQPGTQPGQNCTRLDACWKCDMHWVVATLENVADLILFNEHLKAVQDEEARCNPDVWEKRWLPWLVFTDIAIAKLNQGETAKLFADAAELATVRRADYHPFPLH